MHSKLRPSPAMVIALIALFVSLGGTAAALSGSNTVFSDDIVDNQVYSADLRNDTLAGGGLVSADVRNDIQTSPAGGLGAVDLKPSSVGTSEVTLNSLNGTDINEPSLAIGPTYSGRINGINSGNGSVGQIAEYGTVTGLSTASLNLAATQVLSPNRPVTISDLSVRQTSANSPNGSRGYLIFDDGQNTGIGCAIFAMQSTCDSGSATWAVDPGSALTIRVTTDGTGSAPDAMFGFVAR